MSTARVFIARLSGCAVFDPAGDRVGRVRDALVVFRSSEPPRVVGLIVEVPGRRRVFLSIGRVTSMSGGQVITTGLINLRRFAQRGGEVRVLAELVGRSVTLRDGGHAATIEDLAITESGPGEWVVDQLFLRKPRAVPTPFSKGTTLFARWNEVIENSSGAHPQSAEHLVAAFNELLPADLAASLLELPEIRRLEVAEQLSDDRLADALEEMPEAEQVTLLSQLDDERAADVLDQMEPDDAADLISQLPTLRGEALLDLMDPEEAHDVRFLLTYDSDTAGGLMTTEPIIVSADATVAEGLALIRRHELAPAIGAAICVTLPPYEAPTGRFLGMVHFQRMLRYPPHERLGTIIDRSVEPVQPETSAAEVSRRLASYDLVSLPVVDEHHRLVGVVTIDDVLDYLLPDDWRSADNDAAPPAARPRAGVPVRRASHGTA